MAIDWKLLEGDFAVGRFTARLPIHLPARFPGFIAAFFPALCGGHELERIRDQVGAGALLAFAIHVGIGQQPAVERERAAFAGVLGDDLRIPAKHRDAKPIGDIDPFAVGILFLTVAGDGKVDDGRSAVGEIQTGLLAKPANDLRVR